jgi:3-hydroxyacyl-CoA dehydrogenase
MTKSPVNLEKQQSIGIITIDYPPVNALSQSVRQGLVDGIKELESDDSIKAIIIRCAKRTFIAGADIKEFGSTPLEPHLPDVVNRIEASTKPVVASMFGTSLGGGFEVALACHYRVALADVKVGLPEVNLGLIPGAGGTQRLPRIVGTNKALEMVTGGKHYSVIALSEYNLFDAVFESGSDLDQQTIAYVNAMIDNGEIASDNGETLIKRVGEQPVNDTVEDWDTAIGALTKKSRGKLAPVVAAKLLKRTTNLSIEEGMKLEREEFLSLRTSEQSAALRFAFGAERTAAKTQFDAQPLSVKTVGIIGGGTMGSGIVTAFLSSGFEVILIEQNDEGLKAGTDRINGNFNANVKRGRMSQTQVDGYLAKLTTSTDYQSLSECDLVVEAVFENMDVKKTIFSTLSQVCKPSCILATNTSYLDINEIASVVERPEQVIGMHFFSPANIMKLLEVVKAEKSSEQAVVTAMAVAKQLKKISVLVGVCFGFAGNRMYTRYGREVQQMLLEGASVSQVDQALVNWGMAMGPLAVGDMSGIDIGVSARRAQPFPAFDKGYFKPSELMVDAGRLGRKTKAGYYDYSNNPRGEADPVVAQLISEQSKALEIKQQTFDDETIVSRALLALISEGLQLLEDGIVQRASDIDVIWLHGYGFPRHKGGPMFQASQMGKEKVSQALSNYRASEGALIWPEVDVDLIQ